MRTSSNGKPKRHFLAGTASKEVLEKEAVEALGSGYYEHVADRRGYRNGYRRSRVKSAEGEIEFAVPQLADLAPPFRSKIREVIRGRTEELERLAVEMYARGLSVRDIEAAFTDEAGRCLLSRTAASELTERLWADYQSFASRDLGEFKLLYLFVDGIAEKLHLGQQREAVPGSARTSDPTKDPRPDVNELGGAICRGPSMSAFMCQETACMAPCSRAHDRLWQKPPLTDPPYPNHSLFAARARRNFLL
jgi:Transposase, Mutator family